MDNRSRWIDMINKHNPEYDDLCDLLEEAYQQGREDKYQEIISKYELFTENQVEDIIKGNKHE